MAEEHELLMIKQQFLALEWDRDRLKAEKSVFDKERDRAQKAVLDHRKSIAQNFHRMIQPVQTNPSPVAAENATLFPAGPKTPTPGESVEQVQAILLIMSCPY
jgi:hypothetical protein